MQKDVPRCSSERLLFLIQAWEAPLWPISGHGADGPRPTTGAVPDGPEMPAFPIVVSEKDIFKPRPLGQTHPLPRCTVAMSAAFPIVAAIGHAARPGSPREFLFLACHAPRSAGDHQGQAIPGDRVEQMVVVETDHGQAAHRPAVGLARSPVTTASPRGSGAPGAAGLVCCGGTKPRFTSTSVPSASRSGVSTQKPRPSTVLACT